MAGSKYDGWRQAALLTAIPMVLMGGPVIGYLIGDYLDRLFSTSPWLMVIFIAMGTVSGIQQKIK